MLNVCRSSICWVAFDSNTLFCPINNRRLFCGYLSFSRTMQLTLQRKRQTLAKNWPHMAKRLEVVQKCKSAGISDQFGAPSQSVKLHICAQTSHQVCRTFSLSSFCFDHFENIFQMNFPNSIQISQMICFSRVGLSGTLINLTHLVTEPRPALKRSPVVER